MATPTNLPATFVAGNILTALQVNDLRGAFRVLQIVSGTTTTAVSNSTRTLADTTLTATITPQSISSKILVLVNHADCGKSAGNANNAIWMELWRGAANISLLEKYCGYTASALANNFQINGMYLDSPASVAALVYKTRFMQGLAANDVVTVQGNGVASSIILVELSF